MQKTEQPLPQPTAGGMYRRAPDGSLQPLGTPATPLTPAATGQNQHEVQRNANK